jgi:hypothetical protein
MAIGDIYRITMQVSYLDQECSNRFFYRNTSVDGNAEDAGRAVNSEVTPAIRDAVSDDVLWQGYEVVNLNDIDDFAYVGSGFTGALSGVTTAPFLAWGFRLNRSSRSIRNGSKRFVGVVEEAMDNRGEPTTTQQPLLDAIATALADTIENNLNTGPQFEPVLVRLNQVTQLPELVVKVQSAVFTRLTTQNSRKFGRGR